MPAQGRTFWRPGLTHLCACPMRVKGTAIYRLRDGRMLNVALVDKHGEPLPDFLAEVPIASSFCQYVLRDGSFLTGDSGSDTRLNGHPYQGVMLSYCGIPIFDLQGRAVGTACHFDLVARDIADEKVAHLRAAIIVTLAGAAIGIQRMEARRK